MYLYIAKFLNQPGLVKIGFSEEPNKRVTQLSAVHGTGTLLHKFFTGLKFRWVEKDVHVEFKAYNVKVKGAGGNEFFCEDILAQVIEYVISAHLPPELEPFLREEAIQWKRCVEFSRRMLGVDNGMLRKSDETFLRDVGRISLGIQILREHGMGKREAYDTYAKLLSQKHEHFPMCKKLTGLRLLVVVECRGESQIIKDKWRSVLSKHYKKAKDERDNIETELGVKKC